MVGGPFGSEETVRVNEFMMGMSKNYVVKLAHQNYFTSHTEQGGGIFKETVPHLMMGIYMAPVNVSSILNIFLFFLYKSISTLDMYYPTTWENKVWFKVAIPKVNLTWVNFSLCIKKEYPIKYFFFYKFIFVGLGELKPKTGFFKVDSERSGNWQTSFNMSFPPPLLIFST